MQRSGIIFQLMMGKITWSHLTLCALTAQEPEAWQVLTDLEQIADSYKTRYRGQHTCSPASVQSHRVTQQPGPALLQSRQQHCRALSA